MTEKDKQKDDYFISEKSSKIRSIAGLLTFSTILPINIYTSIEEMAKNDLVLANDKCFMWFFLL